MGEVLKMDQIGRKPLTENRRMCTNVSCVIRTQMVMHRRLGSYAEWQD